MPKRCSWVKMNNPLYIAYHDEEWGQPLHDDQALFELLCLETYQAGLSWETVLNKRQAFREVFHGYHIQHVADMTDEELELEDGEAVITPGFFDKCTYMVEGAQTGEVSILDRDGEAYVTVRFDAPLFALWSPEGKEAPFLCIEPWYGRCDAVDFEGSLAERPYENALAAGGSFDAEYAIVFA